MTKSEAAPDQRRVEVISCKEYEHVWIDDPIALLDENNRLIVDSDVDGRDAFSVEFHKGRMRLRASSLIGIIPLNDRVVLKVRPRVPISNLARMIEDTGHDTQILRAFRGYEGSGTASDWIMDLYAEALIDHTDTLLNRGLHRAYRRREDSGSLPRGHIDFNRTINRFAARNVNHVVAYDWFERSVDNGPNRCLKAALLRVHAHLTRGKDQRGYRTLVTRLAGQLAAFADVADDDGSQAYLSDPEVTGHRALPEARDYYRSPLDLAIVILRDDGLLLEPNETEDVTLPSMLIEMNKLFEKFVHVSLERHAVNHGWPVDVLDGNKDGSLQLYETPAALPTVNGVTLDPMYVGQKAKATPDLVFRMPDGTIPLVAELKNRITEGAIPERSEVNQAVTYALRYGLKKVLIVHPWTAGTTGLLYSGNLGGVDVFDYRLNLGVEDLDESLREFASAVQGLLPASATTTATPLIQVSA